MAVRRPPEPFHRVYSPPEPPPTARRPAIFGFLAVALGAVLSVVIGFLIGFGGGPDQATGPADKASVGKGPVPDTSASANAPDTPASANAPGGAGSGRVFSAVPRPCGGVTERTLDRLIERRTTDKSSNTSLATCTFASTGGDFRWLRIEMRVIPPTVSDAPVRDAQSFFGAQWDRAHRDALSKTISLRRFAGLGDEAYRWFKSDEGQSTVVAEVAVRFSNALITVSYSYKAPSKRDSAESERAGLADATSVTREVLTLFR